MKTRGSATIWAIVVVLVVVSAVVSWTRLAGLPDLGMLLGPELTVRHVAVEQHLVPDEQQFKRGDRLRAMSSTHEWHELDELEELRALLGPLVSEAEPPEFEVPEGHPEDVDEVFDEEVHEAVVEDKVALEYHLLRPQHRFQVEAEGGELPEGEVRQGRDGGRADKLMEVDGVWVGGVGPEGLANYLANYPDGSFNFKRSDADFTGQILVDEQPTRSEVVLIFMLALLIVGVIWRWQSDSLEPRASVCVALGVVCLGWVSLLLVDFQWVLADPVLAAGVVAGLVLMRPLAIFARKLGRPDGLVGGWAALGIGGAVALGLIGAMTGGLLPYPEEALHGAALVMALFVVYELSASGSDGNSMFGLGEREGYLAGVVVMTLFAAMVALVVQPELFQEHRWRWFAVSVPALMLFGDVLYALKQGSYSAMGEVADRRARSSVIRRYLREMTLEMPHTDLRVVGTVDGTAVQLRLDNSSVAVELADEALADAVDILIAERATVPLPETVDRQSHPMAGIATAMDISLAVVLTPPPGSLVLEDNGVDTALVGMRQSSEGDVPSYASSETLDRAQELWTGPVASAALIEMMARATRAGVVDVDSTDESSPALERKLKKARDKADEVQAENEELVAQRDRVQKQAEQIERREHLERLTYRPDHPEAGDDWQLLEPELVDGLEFLLETSEPIVFGGPVGVGKGFVADRTHRLAGEDSHSLAIVDTGDPDTETRLDTILGDAGGGTGPGLLTGFDGGLLIRGAQRCDDGRLLALCHQCEEEGFRLYLSFESERAEQQSVFAGRSQVLQELLEHREVVIPSFRKRQAIQLPVLELWLSKWSRRYDKPIEAFSRMAVEALQAYHYPGEVAEAVEIVRLAVIACEYDVIDRENLALRVREAAPL